MRIGILGLITTGTPNWVSPALLGGLRFVQPLAVAKHRVSQLRDEERCDFVVVLTHQGFERDPKSGKDRRGSASENQAYALATQVPGVDLVLSGHAHVVVNPQRIGGVWVSAPGRWGETLTRFDVAFEKPAEAGRWRVAEVRGKSLPMKKVIPDPDVVAAVAAVPRRGDEGPRREARRSHRGRLDARSEGGGLGHGRLGAPGAASRKGAPSSPSPRSFHPGLSSGRRARSRCDRSGSSTPTRTVS